MAPLDFLKKIKNYYSKESEPPPLSITLVVSLSVRYATFVNVEVPRTNAFPHKENYVFEGAAAKDSSKRGAVLLESKIVFTALYVLPFYLSATTRPSPNIHRDSPAVIRARIRTVTLACAVCALTTVYVIGENAHPTSSQVLHLLGWWPIFPSDVFRPLLLTMILFTGPFFERAIAEGGLRHWITGRPMLETLGSYIGWRNFVAGPVTEEFLFRSLLTPLSLLTYLTPKQTIFITPLYFGIAHVHHFYEFTLTHPQVPKSHALLNSLFQLAYTTLFGWYANFVFVRTGSLLAVIFCHSWCNWMGLPRVWGRVRAGDVIGPPGGGGAGGGDQGWDGGATELRDRRDHASRRPARKKVQIAGGELGLAWTVVYYLLLVAGAVGFWRGLWVLTESEWRLAEI